MKKSHFFTVTICKYSSGWPGIYFKESGEHFYITSGSIKDNRIIRNIMELSELWPVWVDREYYPSKQYVPASNEEFRAAFNKIIDTHNVWASDDYVEFGP